MFVDVGESVSVEQLFNNIRSAFSEPLSIVVHCAGILRTAPLCECTDELFDDVIRVNLRGTFLVNRAAGRDMCRAGTPLPRGGAAIVNISSITAKCCSASAAAYAAAKAGVVALTKSAASELAEHGIRCNAVMPGWVETPLMANIGATLKAKVLSSTPLRKTAQPWEIAEAIKFLWSPAVSSFITGATLEVTGGFYM
ncbi:estradiol 17-beta-dehydrogenase 8-like [Dermacentor andersoni]|uniref:estradiol 17-beta-dehydrogenase 8-like n=1 Tax=Dermacentor andersoni TaxID=34620 RepID=UPI0024166836|nr:estradiol 17-beta-dehydrogenase 8-like [Dermacentor andersoni]